MVENSIIITINSDGSLQIVDLNREYTLSNDAVFLEQLDSVLITDNGVTTNLKIFEVDKVIDINGVETIINSANLLYSLLISAEQEDKINQVVSHFIYNPLTDKLEADRAIETTLASLYLGKQHRMSSGGENVFFTNESSKVNYYPVWGGLKDMSIPSNKGAAGIVPPFARNYSSFSTIELNGTVATGVTSTDNSAVIPFAVSGVGATMVFEDDIIPSDIVYYKIWYGLDDSGIQAFESRKTGLTHSAGNSFEWIYEHPVETKAGQAIYARLEIESIDGSIRTLQARKSVTGNLWISLQTFLYTDDDIALKSDIEAIIAGSIYRGAYDSSTDTPTLTLSGSESNGDYFRVSVSGEDYEVGDLIIFNGTTTSYDHIPVKSLTQSLLETSPLKIYDVYVKSGFVSSTKNGSALYPYSDIQQAVDNSFDGDSIFLDGEFNITIEITLPSDKSLTFVGANNTTIKYASYNVSNGDVMSFDGDSTKTLIFKDITFKNAGGYGLLIKNTEKVELRNCKFFNNGWDGTQLHTAASKTLTGLLGYDSTQAELQAFYASSHASNGGALRLENCRIPLVRECRAENNLRGLRIQDCGINGGGFVIENQSINNIESGIYIATGALGGCQNITVTINYSSYNANNGLLVIGGINNKFSQNEVNGNWNAGFCAWGASNVTLRDCGLYDNNRSTYNGIGNVGDAKASIQINDAYSFIATQITYNPDFRFIAEILDTQVHYTGLGSNTEKIGFLMTSGMGLIPDNDKNIIKVDDVGFIGQDYAIDLSEVDVSNLRLSLGDNSYQNIGEKAVKPPLSGKYYELPFSNHTTNINYANFSVDLTGSIIIKEGATGNRMNPYKVNDLQAIANGAKIDIILKDSNKIQFTVPVSGCSIDGTFVNSVLNQALVQLNGVFTNTVGFSSGGNPVTNFVLSGTDLTITLQDATSFTVDVTSLGVDENKFVSSGAVSGSDLDLTMNDSSIITIDISNMVNGSSLTATNDKWFISYGTNANQEVGTSINDSTINQQLPFYFGQSLKQGSQFKWNFNSNGGSNLILGIWDGAEVATPYNGGSITPSNWGTSFTYAGGFMDGSNSTLTNTTNGTKYVVGTGDALGIKFDDLGLLTLIDYSGATPIEIAKTTIALGVTEFNIQMHTWSNGVLPNGIISEAGWSIVHDFDNSEDGIINGIKDHTVIKSEISILPGEKIMFMLDEVGQGDFFGTNYTAASSGVSTAEEQLDNTFIYQTNEAIVLDTSSGVSDWNANTSATNYFLSASLNQYRDGGSGTIQGMFSLRYMTDNSIEIFDEDANEVVATAKQNGNGSSISLFFGTKGNRAYYSIPVISKQTIGQGSQPDVNFVPTVANQTATVTESDVLNFQIVSSDNIVNQFVELDAPSWMSLNQTTGVLSGTAPAYVGTSADTILVNCKAGNAVGGTIDFTITVSVAEVSYTNSKSLSFNGTGNWLQSNPVDMNALERASNGDGNAWTISMWVKPNSGTGTQTLMVYGAGWSGNGVITLQQSGGNNIILDYGTTSNKIVIAALNCLTVGSWNHLVVTFDGGTTGVNQADLSDYYSRFSVAVDGVVVSQAGSHLNYGYTGVISGSNPSDNIFRIGRASNVNNNYFGGIINQVAIWGSDESANLSTIYNSGAVQDLSLLASAPYHYYEIETSITTITDVEGSANLTGYNFIASDLVTDAP
mgnify:CR=1 FL=1